MEKKIIPIVLVFAVIAILMAVLLSKFLSFNFMPFGFGGSKGTIMFLALFGVGGILLWLSYSMLK